MFVLGVAFLLLLFVSCVVFFFVCLFFVEVFFQWLDAFGFIWRRKKARHIVVVAAGFVRVGEKARVVV